jgi:hypothetical protein
MTNAIDDSSPLPLFVAVHMVTNNWRMMSSSDASRTDATIPPRPGCRHWTMIATTILIWTGHTLWSVSPTPLVKNVVVLSPLCQSDETSNHCYNKNNSKNNNQTTNTNANNNKSGHRQRSRQYQ